MARVNGRMPGKHIVGPSCRGGQKCCRNPIEEKNHIDHIVWREEMELADEELHDNPHELEDDPDWDGKLSDWDLPDDVKYVKFIPAPKDDSGW